MNEYEKRHPDVVLTVESEGWRFRWNASNDASVKVGPVEGYHGDRLDGWTHQMDPPSREVRVGGRIDLKPFQQLVDEFGEQSYEWALDQNREPCIVCGAPIDELGRGHDEGCPVDQEVSA